MEHIGTDRMVWPVIWWEFMEQLLEGFQHGGDGHPQNNARQLGCISPNGASCLGTRLHILQRESHTAPGWPSPSAYPSHGILFPSARASNAETTKNPLELSSANTGAASGGAHQFPQVQHKCEEHCRRAHYHGVKAPCASCPSPGTKVLLSSCGWIHRDDLGCTCSGSSWLSSWWTHDEPLLHRWRTWQAWRLSRSASAELSGVCSLLDPPTLLTGVSVLGRKYSTSFHRPKSHATTGEVQSEGDQGSHDRCPPFFVSARQSAVLERSERRFSAFGDLSLRYCGCYLHWHAPGEPNLGEWHGHCLVQCAGFGKWLGCSLLSWGPHCVVDRGKRIAGQLEISHPVAHRSLAQRENAMHPPESGPNPDGSFALHTKELIMKCCSAFPCLPLFRTRSGSIQAPPKNSQSQSKEATLWHTNTIVTMDSCCRQHRCTSKSGEISQRNTQVP